MSRVETTNEKRAEQRLRYRWPVRFAVRAGQKPCSGQAVDVTSRGMAFLYHPGENCPRPDQLVTANFGVPHFNAHGSFDTVVFNRIGRVCRVDSLSEKVSCVAVQFAEPLFFKPGEQSISDSDAQQRLGAGAPSVIEARQKADTRHGTSAKAKSETRSRTQRPVAIEKGNGTQNVEEAMGRQLLKKVDSFITDKNKVF